MYEIFEKLLAEHNVSAYQVSKATGISTSTLSEWKKGKYSLKLDKLQKIADYFDVSLDYLLGTEKEKSPDNAEDKVTLDDFTYAMYNHSSDLTEDEKKMLLEMADFMKKKRGL